VWGRGRRNRRYKRHQQVARIRTNKRFIVSSTQSESTAGKKISQFIMQLILAGKNKTTNRAGKAMVHRELLTIAITVRRKIRVLGIAEI